MVNLHLQFQAFHEKVALSPGKKESLRQSRDAIRSRIENYFKDRLKFEVPKFHAQGSFEMGTTVNPLDGEFDLDDGVYLQHLDQYDQTGWPSPETVHSWIVEATDGYTKEKPIDKRTCVRVRYAGDYHIDLPSYGTLNGRPMLAEKGEKGWHESDPIGLTEWFAGQVQAQGDQLRRVVRYMKAWADFQSAKRGKMPSSLILTVLVAQNLRSHDEEKKRFQAAIADLANDAAKAVQTENKKEASELWQGQLGDRFPLVNEEEEEEQKKANADRFAAFYAPRGPTKPWGLN